ncbi:bifunctional phosphopantothenoylcysteine decarboxylase/phosphopantothenate--cysteine ligase CoaBC [Candidatus Roizmanbacteria bacterium]|nr:bifunctional phosphopantothenoylcysteine decarboxylase/phosphopantothenate--cysteine ligase CoaBC [Candidatus Roizmanbacteria bacterium]
MKKTVLIGISSGIAAYKAVALIKLLQQENFVIEVTMTAHAVQMIPPRLIEKITKKKIHTNLFKEGFDYKNILKERKVDHIELADKSDLMVIVPATANIIAKIAHGIADDLLTTTALAVTTPILICPSMNVHMWTNPLVQENIKKLKNLGYQIIEPVEGMLACGYEGKGRLEDVYLIRDEIVSNLNYADLLRGRKIIVTSGGTREKIDDVRYITNRSSGKMGTAVAESCYKRGGEVLLLRANSAVQPRFSIPEKTFDTAEELFRLIKENIKTYDTLYHVAAVSDFTIKNRKEGKLSSNQKIALILEPRRKILDQIKKMNPKIRLIAFKAEYGLKDSQLIKAAYKRLLEAKANAVVANDISKPDRGFQSDKNEVIIVWESGEYKKIPLGLKRTVAEEIVDSIESVLALSVND